MGIEYEELNVNIVVPIPDAPNDDTYLISLVEPLGFDWDITPSDEGDLFIIQIARWNDDPIAGSFLIHKLVNSLLKFTVDGFID